jgi:hypothetical protein
MGSVTSTDCLSAYAHVLYCSLTSTPAGKLMAANYLKLKTMAAIMQLGERPNVPSLLRVICSAEEFKNTCLRRYVCRQQCSTCS